MKGLKPFILRWEEVAGKAQQEDAFTGMGGDGQSFWKMRDTSTSTLRLLGLKPVVQKV